MLAVVLFLLDKEVHRCCRCIFSVYFLSLHRAGSGKLDSWQQRSDDNPCEHHQFTELKKKPCRVTGASAELLFGKAPVPYGDQEAGRNREESRPVIDEQHECSSCSGGQDEDDANGNARFPRRERI